MLPLALYLGSFVLVFSWQNREVQAKLARWLPAVVLLVLVVPLAEGTEPILLVMTIHLLGFFWIAVVCHGELARSKPAPAAFDRILLSGWPSAACSAA